MLPHPERFWSKVNKTETCWLWTAGKNNNGYGLYWLNNKTISAHRVVYELMVGPIPTGLTIDHVKARGCINRHCVNPKHLELVPWIINYRRGDNADRRKTHCPKGHPYAGDNLYIDPGRGARHCKTCHKITRLKRVNRKGRATHLT